MRRLIVRGPKSRRIADRLAHAKLVAQSLTGNPDFPDPIPALAKLIVHIAAAEAALVASLTKRKGTAAALKAALVAVEGDLKTLYVLVETVANRHPTDGPAIIERAGMSRKNARGPSPAELTVKQGNISGSVLLVARAIARKASYEWQYSTDQERWVNADTTFKCKAELFGLKRGTRHYFRFRARTPAGLGKWSQVVSLIVA
jgi:hypothetical protein